MLKEHPLSFTAAQKKFTATTTHTFGRRAVKKLKSRRRYGEGGEGSAVPCKPTRLGMLQFRMPK